MNPIPYGKQNISQEDINGVIEVLQSDYLTQGPKIEEFEKKFANYIGCKYAVAVSNGTAALHLSALALNIESGDKVLTTPITFAASANAVKYCGGEIDFIDIDPDTFLLDLDKLEEKLSSVQIGTYKGIISVDFAGYPIDIERLKKIAKIYNLWIIEDACHAPGAYIIDSFGSKNFCGNGIYSDLAVFSFHPVKHIACGEGGMITTNYIELYNRLLSLRTHGITKKPDLLFENHGGWYYEMQELGYNYRLTDIQATLGISQLKNLELSIKKRNEIANKYDEAFRNTQIITPQRGNNLRHAFHLYVIQVENRKELYDFLRENNIYSQLHYVPVHKMPYYNKNNDFSFPVAEAYYSSCLSLPMYPTLSDNEQDYVIRTIKKFYEK